MLVRTALRKAKTPGGRDYYWALWSEPEEPPSDETDIRQLRKGNVTLTPLRFDLTRTELLGQMPGWGLKP